MNKLALYYFIVLDVIGICLNCLLYYYATKHQAENKIIGFLQTLVTILGGAFGGIISDIFLRKISPGINLKDFPKEERKEIRHQIKQEMNAEYLSTIYYALWTMIHMIVFHLFFGPKSEICKAWLIGFIRQHAFLCIYIVLINLGTFTLFAIDKIAAINHHRRIGVKVLLLFSFFGGSIGAYLAMDLLNHKVRADEFAKGVPMMIIMHLSLMSLVFTDLL